MVLCLRSFVNGSKSSKNDESTCVIVFRIRLLLTMLFYL